MISFCLFLGTSPAPEWTTKAGSQIKLTFCVFFFIFSYNFVLDNFKLIVQYFFHLDCLHLNGSNYHGNISVTASGIPCQSWTEQCPHRHTMNKTYPELNDAKNYCRNPQNSGQRPWCFTTDRKKRWEYCDIPKCTPGMKQNCTVISLNVHQVKNRTVL